GLSSGRREEVADTRRRRVDCRRHGTRPPERAGRVGGGRVMPEPGPGDRVVVLVDHYHRAADQASERWQERNRRFLFLVGVLALAVLATANPGETDSFLVTLLAKFAGVADADITKLRESFPYVVLHGLLVVLVFYFMTDVFRLNANIIGNYE